MPRFYSDNFARNLPLLDGLRTLAKETGATPAQLALAWLLARDESILPIPGTTSINHLEENMGADSVQLDSGLMDKLDGLINQQTVIGTRYNEATQAEIDTEEFRNA
jgi:aryl-alcohol dehydrogenase-like predicted oxidoreductase